MGVTEENKLSSLSNSSAGRAIPDQPFVPELRTSSRAVDGMSRFVRRFHHLK